MGKVTCHLTISADGCAAGPYQSEIHAGTNAGTYIMGRNMFEGVPPLKLEQTYGRAASTVTHVTYRAPSAPAERG